MSLPHIHFRFEPLENYIDNLCFFITAKDPIYIGMGNYILGENPNLKKDIDLSKPYDEIKEFVFNYFKSREDKSLIEEKSLLFQEHWNKYEYEAFTNLIDILEVNLPSDFGDITGQVNLNPISPRDILDRSFQIHLDTSLERMNDISTHESLHYFYFVKWQEVFPQTDTREYDSPHLAWHLSEMFVPILKFNSNSFIKNIFGEGSNGYRIHRKMRIDGVNPIKYLDEIYNNRDNFTDFLIKAYEYMQENKTHFEKFN